MPAATIRSALPGAAVDTDAVALDLDDFARAADADCIGALACGRASFSYRLLPEPPLHLTIRKLDRSYFDVQVAGSATVSELKVAIKEFFIPLFAGSENAVPWQHLWSHFCLCFKEEKLTDDKATLRAFGIKDGDELHFAQHLYVDYIPCKSPKSQKAASHTRSKTSLDNFGRSGTLLDDLAEEDDGEKKVADARHSTSVMDDGFCAYQHPEEYMEESRKKGSFFRGWFSFSTLRSNRRTHSENVVRSSCEKKSTQTKLGKWLSFRKPKAQSK